MSILTAALEPRQAKLQCTQCGATADAACACGAPYVPAADRVAEYDAAHPGQSNRAVAKALKVSEKTVRKARARSGADRSAGDNVIGLDGKTYKAKGKERPNFEALQAKAESIGWHFSRLGDGKFDIWKQLGEPCPAGGAVDVWRIPTTLRDAAATLDDIERNPQEYEKEFPEKYRPDFVQVITPIEEHRAAMAALDQPPAPEPIAAEPIAAEPDSGDFDFARFKQQLAELAENAKRLTPAQARARSNDRHAKRHLRHRRRRR
jgi:hypothetical protein